MWSRKKILKANMWPKSKAVIRRKLDRKCYGQMKKYKKKYNDRQNTTQKTK